MNSLQFFKAHREIELNITRCIGIVGKIQMVMKAIILTAKPKRLMPFHSLFLPVFIPLHFFTWFDEELHFHLFKFTHAKNKLTSYNLITKGLTDLSNTKWYFHTAGFLHIQKIHKNSLSRFRAQINFIGVLC